MQLYYHSLANLTEARFAASLYPLYLGFCFSGSVSGSLDPVAFSKIKPWLSGAELVGQYTYEPGHIIAVQLDTLGLTCVEVPHDHPELAMLMDSFSVITTGGYISGAEAYRMDYMSCLNSKLPSAPVPCFVDFTQPDVALIKDVLGKNSGLALAYKGGIQEQEPGMADLSAPADLMEDLGLL